jgi:hypothetical protein
MLIELYDTRRDIRVTRADQTDRLLPERENPPTRVDYKACAESRFLSFVPFLVQTRTLKDK